MSRQSPRAVGQAKIDSSESATPKTSGRTSERKAAGKIIVDVQPSNAPASSQLPSTPTSTSDRPNKKRTSFIDEERSEPERKRARKIENSDYDPAMDSRLGMFDIVKGLYPLLSKSRRKALMHDLCRAAEEGVTEHD